MHNTYYFLNALTKDLNPKIKGFILADCFSQNKNELILHFTKENKDIYLLANLNREFNVFSINLNFKKAKSNYTSFFKQSIGQRCTGIVQVPFDRSFYLSFKDSSKLLFKLHGHKANVLYFKKSETAEQLFNPKFEEDLLFELQELQKARPEILEIIDSQNELLDSNKLLGKEAKNWLISKFDDCKNLEEKKGIFYDFIQSLENWESHFYLNGLELTPWHTKNSLVYNSPIEASNALFEALNYHYFYTIRKQDALKELEKNKKKLTLYVQKASSELHKLVYESNFRQRADVVMANLHRLTQSEQEYTLDNFYDNSTFVFKFKRTEKPQLIAQKWYSKAKNVHKQIEKLSQTIENKKEKLQSVSDNIDILLAISTPKELNNYLKTEEKAILKEQICPFKQVFFEGFEILIGRNSKNNDELVKFGHKNDLWLHAKDVSGSHVLIRVNQKIVPKTIIAFAASLAAYYSKRKTDTICPVTYTELKYVRKKKGFLPGQVAVEREKVIFATPISISEAPLIQE